MPAVSGEVIVWVRIAPEDGAEAADLFEWLRSDLDVARGAEVRPGPAAPGTLGALEVVDVVLTQAAAFSGLAMAIVSWRQSRPRSKPITITRPDGATLTLPGDDPGNAAVIRAFLAGDEDGPGPDPR
jgi:hypothetical protein